jgi:hypothetical protein
MSDHVRDDLLDFVNGRLSEERVAEIQRHSTRATSAAPMPAGSGNSSSGWR